ncbi:MAG: hypothetical protein IT210_04680 [Armatimonadetes bacterium]|nr:hypothetical protein [Armatimonadota bacterium]
MDERDEDMIRRVRAGEIDAFGELMSRCQQWIYGLTYHRVGHFADAQDIAQEAFIQAYRNLSRLRQPERSPAWLKAIAVNVSRAPAVLDLAENRSALERLQDIAG